MPAPSSDQNLNQTAEERKKRAQDFFEEIKTNAAPQQSRSSLVIGFNAYQMKKENLFGMLGFADEEAARDAAGVGRSTWYSTISLAHSFEGLPKDLFITMKLVNAQEFLNLGASKRMDRDWVTKAADMTEKEFKKLVDEELNGKAKVTDGKERSVKMTVDMPASRKMVIEEKVKEFAEAHDMEPADTGKVLEAMVVEATGGETMLNAVLHVVQRAKRIKELCESGLSADEVLAQVVVLNEENILECASVLEVKTAEADEAA
jgi:hypothetical protein